MRVRSWPGRLKRAIRNRSLQLGVVDRDSVYDDEASVRTSVVRRQHRAIIGGLWNEMGELQFDFLKQAGLEPDHFLLDVGCGSLRGGVKFVRYLEPGHHFGTDINESLLPAGYDIELADAGLQGKLPRANLICNRDFGIPVPDETFDFMLAQSVFTHLSLGRIRLCLKKAAPKIKPGGVFYATFFEISDGADPSRAQKHAPGGIVTYGARD